MFFEQAKLIELLYLRVKQLNALPPPPEPILRITLGERSFIQQNNLVRCNRCYVGFKLPSDAKGRNQMMQRAHSHMCSLRI